MKFYVTQKRNHESFCDWSQNEAGARMELVPERSFCLLMFYQILSLASFLPTWTALRTVSDVKAVEILSSVETLKITFDP